MKKVLPLLILLTAIFYIFILPESPLAIKLLFKALPMVLMIIYALINLPKQRFFIHYAVVIGLIFSLIGDVTLHWFVIGLSAFLLGHIFYMAGFITKFKPSLVRGMTIVPLVIYSYILGNGILNSLTDSSLSFPITLYIIVISAMAWTAIMTRNLYAAIGAVLFVISDSILAWNLFVTTIPLSSILVMSTYYSAQFLIVFSLRSYDS
ncbi:lysoplasmalogenase [Piscibacillus salipiscarius]|uniref:Lysoplasmalogenase n=1 Tax=Piscibacillus salipiscarius TaxID=299480 RepID=A0ABW5Q839_9BACI|nr:lysoplasmalogenase [Piscibacillus salipiscarius]